MESACPLPPQLEGKVKLSTGCPWHTVTTPVTALWDAWQRAGWISLTESREAEKRGQNCGVAAVGGCRDKGPVWEGEWAPWGHGLTAAKPPPMTEEGKGETEIRSPCECEALVQFQTNTVAILQSLTEKNILWGDAWAAQGAEQP